MPETTPDFAKFTHFVEYGFVHDDMGSTEIFPTLEEAQEAKKQWSEDDGIDYPLVIITTTPFVQ